VGIVAAGQRGVVDPAGELGLVGGVEQPGVVDVVRSQGAVWQLPDRHVRLTMPGRAGALAGRLTAGHRRELDQPDPIGIGPQ
jgi:hypothetical protein